MNVIYNIIATLAGLGVLIFGIKTMNKALENLMGMKFKSALSNVSRNNFKSYGVGLGLTMVAQTSLLTSSMVVGLINTGTIGLSQSMALILGAITGSSFFHIIMAFQSINLVSIFSIFAFIGVMILFFVKNTKMTNISLVIIGFGLLCLGLSLISSNTSEITSIEGVSNFISNLTNPLLLILCGFILALLMHSSTPVVALAIALCGTGGEIGPMSITSGCLLVLGAFVGTAIVHMYINGFGDTTDSKRLLTYDVLVRFMGALIMGLLLLTGWQNWLYSFCFNDSSIALVVFGICVGLISVIIALPTIPVAEKFMRLIVKNKKKTASELDVFSIDEHTIKIPVIAQSSVMLGISKILEMEVDLSKNLCRYMFEKDIDDKGFKNKFKTLERAIKLTTNNIIRISGVQGRNSVEYCNSLLDITNDTNHILKVCTRLYDYGKEVNEKPRKLISSHIGVLMPISIQVNNLGNNVVKYINEKTKNKDELLKEMFDIQDKNTNQNTKAKHMLFDEKVKKDNTIYLSVLYELGKLNTDYINVAIKTNLMEV